MINLFYSVPKIFIRNVQFIWIFRIVLAVTISKTIRGIEWDTL